MDSIATAILLMLFLTAFANYRAGTLKTWLGAKFFNSGEPSRSSAFDASTPQVSASPTGFNQPSTDGLVWPVSAPISQNFALPNHEGIDLAAPMGTPIKAAHSGKVSYAGGMGGYGNTVDISQGTSSQRYGHMSQIAVSLGQSVNAGDVIGYVGNTGNSTGPHLHFETRTNGTATDPLQWLKKLVNA